MSERGGEWHLLEHDGDPVPGDPTVVGDEAWHYAAVARAISSQAGRLRLLAVPDAAMSGLYADALLIRMHNLAGDLAVMHARFEVTGSQLARLEPALATARAKTQSALDDAIEAKSTMDANAPDRHTSQGAESPAEVDVDAERSRAKAHGQGEDALDAARRACRHAMDTFDDVADSVARKISAAADDRLKDSLSETVLGWLGLGGSGLDDPYAPPPIGTPSDQLLELLVLARESTDDPQEYADLLQQYYVTRAAEKAGIDLTTWDVSQGASAVSEHYERTYAYYAQLYLDDPSFRWAGMAAMIGPSFAAGFEDLEFFQTVASDLADVLGPVPDGALPFPAGQLDEVAGMTEGELRFYQTTFLQMQKDIFYDASMMHEAYLEGGMGSIDELRQAGLLGSDPRQADQAYDSWRDIDTARRTGDTDLLNRGNEQLLYREQFYTIANQYQAMKDHNPTGEVMTYMMGLVGQPSIPGTRTLGEVDNPIVVPIDTMPLVPGTQGGEVTLNIPRSNIADFDTRWGLIKDDTLPVYIDLVENDPGRVEDILRQGVGGRIDEMRLSKRWPDLLDGLVDVDGRLW